LVPGTGGDGSEEVITRIDILMGELTRLMDSLESNNSGAYTGGVNN
jgi:hypothetical protein